MTNFVKAGLALCLVSFALASSVLARNGSDFDPREPSLKQSGHWEWIDYGFTPREPSIKQSGRWEWKWDGTDSLSIGLVGATVRYIPNLPARIVITGPDEALERLRVGQGQIRWCQNCRAIKGLEITVSGVTLHNVALSGADINIQLGRLDQDRLRLAISGTGEINASGRIDRIDASISGAGSIQMADTRVQRANINIAGSGDVAMTPREEANVHVAGSGRVRMTAMPARLNQSVTGSGGVRVVGN